MPFVRNNNTKSDPANKRKKQTFTMRLQRESEEIELRTTHGDGTDSEGESKNFEIKIEDSSSEIIILDSDEESNHFVTSCKNNEIKQKLGLDSGHIQKEDEMEFQKIENHSLPEAANTNLDSEDHNIKLINFNILKSELEQTQTSKKKNYIANQAHDLIHVEQTKIERDSELGNKSNVASKDASFVIPEVSHISVGEIKIEDCNYISPLEDESSDIEIIINDNSIDISSDSEVESSNAKIQFNDDVHISLGDKNANIVSIGNEKLDIPTSSQTHLRNIKKESNEIYLRTAKENELLVPLKFGGNPNSGSYSGKEYLFINKSADINEEKEFISSKKEDVNLIHSSDSKEVEEFISSIKEDVNTNNSSYLKEENEFISTPYECEEFLSDDERSVSQNFNIKNKEVVSQLIEEYHKRPELWFDELSTRFSDLQKNKMFQSITDKMNSKFNMKFDENRTRMILNFLCNQYEGEILRQLKANEETTAENSTLWFCDEMEFLKDGIKNKLKPKLEESVELPEDKLDDLIDIYKNYDSLWDISNSSYADKKKRDETIQAMCHEIKNKMQFSLNPLYLGNLLLNIHKLFAKDKRHRLECEGNQKEFMPSFPYFFKCDFLVKYEGPFKCTNCHEIIETYYQFIEHRAQHDVANKFKCNICGIVCKDGKAFDYHNYRHNGVNYSCNICGNRFFHPKLLKTHVKYVHTQVSKDKTFNCNICGKSFETAKRLKCHEMTMHNQKEIQCKICGVVCKNEKSFKYHSFRHNGKKYDCKICGNSFTHPSNLDSHMQTHKITYKCNFCKKTCSSKRSLNYHEKFCEFRSIVTS